MTDMVKLNHSHLEKVRQGSEKDGCASWVKGIETH